MSQILDQMLFSAKEYLAREISVDEFRQHFAGAYVAARNHSRQEAEANKLANAIVGLVAEYGVHNSEAELRRSLENAVLPFDRIPKYPAARFA